MRVRRAVRAGTIALVTALAATFTAARADETYAVSGRDVFRIGNGEVHSETVYHGVERLAIARGRGGTTYVAQVEYDKDGDGGKQHDRASFTSTLLPSGEMRDGPAHDPDYLTILNQPFAVQLDAATMRDLQRVKRPVPFDFPSPMTGAPLRGTLRRLADMRIGTTRAMGIAFTAGGPLHGALPDRPSMALTGSIKMTGTAYYAYDTARLVALDATLAIDGSLDDDANRSPVSIVYARSMRASPGAPPRPAGEHSAGRA